MIDWSVFHFLETLAFVFLEWNEELSLYFLKKPCYLLACFVVNELG